MSVDMFQRSQQRKKLGYGALSAKLLVVRIVENDDIDAYIRAG